MSGLNRPVMFVGSGSNNSAYTTESTTTITCTSPQVSAAKPQHHNTTMKGLYQTVAPTYNTQSSTHPTPDVSDVQPHRCI